MDKEEASPFIDDSEVEFLGENSDSDSDFGISSRKKNYGLQVRLGRWGLILCFLTFMVVVVVVTFVVGLLIGHFGVPHNLPVNQENQSSSGTPTPKTTVPTVPAPTAAPCNKSVAEEICQNPPLLLVSLDGFRASYFDRKLTPFMDSLASEGVRAAYMRSVYPTKTFPNHYSIVTGLYPESHGIVNNAFYDTELEDKFYIGSPHQNSAVWWKGEPIWVTAKKNGLRTGVFFWPGSEAEIQGYRPDFYRYYDRRIPYKERVDTVLSWLYLPQALRPQFLALYVEEPDHSGHQGGPNSTQVDEALVRVDQAMQSLFTGLEERQIKDCVNVMIISDHGMAQYNESKLVNLAQYVPSSLSSNVSYSSLGPVACMDTTGGPPVLQSVFDALQTNVSDLALRFYLRETIPYRLHAGHFNKQRYTDIQLLADVGGFIIAPVDYHVSVLNGEHGYDNIYEEVHAIFQAHGPAFKTGYTPEAFDNIHLYSLMCGLLGIPPAPNNGTVGALYHLLTPSQASQFPPTQTYPPNSSQQGTADRCPFPTNESVIASRSFCEECVCRVASDGVDCEGVDNGTIRDANRQLDIMDSTADMYVQTHLPWGTPSLVGEGLDSCLMVQQYYISMYSNRLHIPLWTAYKLTEQQVQDPTISNSTCVRRDPRLLPSNSANCKDYSPHPTFVTAVANISYAHSTLTPVRMVMGVSPEEIKELSTSLLSNFVPQSAEFYTTIWQPMEGLLREWTKLYDTIHVISGVVLDSDYDGSRDPEDEYEWWTGGREGVAVPTQYYVIAVRCLDKGVVPATCQYDQLDAIGFLFQHPLAPGDPSMSSHRLKLSLTQIRDIERVAGVNFFSSLSPQEQNKIELRVVNDLWPAS